MSDAPDTTTTTALLDVHSLIERLTAAVADPAHSDGLQDRLHVEAHGAVLNGPVQVAELTAFLGKALGVGDDDLPDLPMPSATLERLEIRPPSGAGAASGEPDPIGWPVHVELDLSFEEASWSPVVGFDVALRRCEFLMWGRHWSGRVWGSVEFASTTFGLEFEWPSMMVTARVGQDDADATSNLLSSHGLVVGDRSEHPHHDLVELRVEPRTRRFRLEIDTTLKVSIGPLTLESVLLLIERDGPNGAYAGELAASLAFAGGELRVDAATSGSGWTLRAGGDFDDPPTLGDVVGHVVDLVGGRGTLDDVGVPDVFVTSRIAGDIELSASTVEHRVTLRASVPVSGNQGRATFEIDVGADGLEARAELQLGDLQFDAGFTKDGGTDILVAQFASEHGLDVGLSELVQLGRLDGTGRPGPEIGSDMRITVRSVLLAMAHGSTTHQEADAAARQEPDRTDHPPQTATSRYLLAADVAGGIDLSGLGQLPIVGAMLPSDVSVRLSLAPIVVSETWDAELVARVDQLRAPAGPRLPAGIEKSTLATSVTLPQARAPVELGIELGPLDSGDRVPAHPPADDDQASVSDLTWIDVAATLGPVSVGRVGLALERDHQKVRIVLDARVGIAGVELALIGLELDYSLTTEQLDVSLRGMSLDVDRRPIRIVGSFADFGGDFRGRARLELPSATVDVSGGFTIVDGAPSMFVYGILTTPIGGPPAFSVEAVAAGFGINRAIVAPDVAHVHEFPFVADALNPPVPRPTDQDAATELRRLGSAVRPSLHDDFLAVGVKFNSFKVFDSFVLAIVSCGKQPRVDVLGVSTLKNPPQPASGASPLVFIELDLVATIRPDEGSVLVRAVLAPTSYVYSSKVRLGGGFAYASWFGPEHAGDFVITAGGYALGYPRPSHYPEVPRVSLDFAIPDHPVTVKGAAYFALTPAMMMAGGALAVHAEMGPVRAAFGMALDLLVQWEPYHYSASFRVSVAASVGPFSTHASAALRISGPEFGGTAHVDWGALSFDVAFGHELGGPKPLSWSEVAERFLPADQGVLVGWAPTLSVAAGRIGEVTDADGHPVIVVDPRRLRLRIDTVVPFVTFEGDPVKAQHADGSTAEAVVGCRPAGVTSVHTSSLTVEFGDAELTPAVSTKRFPSAVWGAAGQLSLGTSSEVIAGGVVTYRCADAEEHGRLEVERRDLAYSRHSTGTAPATRPLAFGSATRVDGDGLKDLIGPKATPDVSEQRDAVAKLVGLPARRPNVSTLVEGLRCEPWLVSDGSVG